MSYYSSHQLTWDTDVPTQDEIAGILAEMIEVPVHAAREIAFEQSPAKWYDADDHITKLSSTWPATVFTLDCEGENGDRSFTFFKEGRHYTQMYLKPEFDEDSLPQPAPVTA